ncbi:MAG TPA: hypothetical protein DCE56_39555, partial [Cyanobacteria bacterium UBA8553]|nr:hypothetical protein [Cyanobacteria bacterium UBA8553]
MKDSVLSTQQTLLRPQPPKTDHRSRVKFLLVEDTLINQKVVLNQLKVLGYQVDCVSNGQEALERLTNCSSRAELTASDSTFSSPSVATPKREKQQAQERHIQQETAQGSNSPPHPLTP